MAVEGIYESIPSVVETERLKDLITKRNEEYARRAYYPSVPIGEFKPSNPCNEIFISNNAATLTSERIASSVVTGDRITGGAITQDTGKYMMIRSNIETDFDEKKWTIELPGVPREDIEVFQVRETVYVQIKDKPRQQLNLDDDEKVLSTKLELGVLTVIIDRPFKKVPIEVG